MKKENSRKSSFIQTILTTNPEVKKIINQPQWPRRGFGFSRLFNRLLSIYLIYNSGKLFYHAYLKNEEIKTKKIQKTSVKLQDVVGIDEYRADLEQIIDFIRNPKKYKEIGATIPKGVILSGAPGIGKTMLAKALASETNINFIYKSGSEFETKYFGESAKNVHKIFKQARSSKPCILFIDEIDSIGGRRSTKENPIFEYVYDGLNQLLHELDGFEKEDGVLVVAATNKLSDLDPALIRAGRFDKILRIPPPNKKAREELMRYYMEKVKIDSINFKPSYFMDRTTGFTGAEIKNVFNIAAVNAGFHSKSKIDQSDIENALDRVIHGNQPKTTNSEEKHLEKIAYSEAAMAVLAFKVGQLDKINKISLKEVKNPRNKTGFIKGESLGIIDQKILLAQIQLCLSCQIAEKLKFGEDLTTLNCLQKTQQASELATQYVVNNLDQTKEAKDEKIMFNPKTHSDQHKFELEKRKKSVLDKAIESVQSILTKDTAIINEIAKELLEKKLLTRENILEFINHT